jgi:hypothetical protein
VLEPGVSVGCIFCAFEWGCVFRVLLAISYRSVVPVFVMLISLWFILLDSWFLKIAICVEIRTARHFFGLFCKVLDL